MSKKTKTKTLGSNVSIKQNVSEEHRKKIREMISPWGLSSTIPDYIVLKDSGRDIYVSSLYIHKLPKQTRFVETFSLLINYDGVVSNIFIEPIGRREAQRMVDKRVNTTASSETEAATKGIYNRNDLRRATQRRVDAEQWAKELETGTNSLYNVQFLFTLYADSAEELSNKLSDFISKARKRDIDLASCYCCQKEAFLSAFPINKVQAIRGMGPTILKKHVFERQSLGDIFNHTSNTFYHANGIFLGHYLDSFRAFIFDPWDSSHDNYNVIVTGSSGSGKSVLIKLVQSRFADFGVRSRTLDVESKYSRGEYVGTALACGGVWFPIKPGNSSNVLNPFEIRDEIEYDEVADIEYPALRLNEKVVYLSNLIYSMILFNGASIDVAMDSALNSIISSLCNLLYEERGFVEGDADSVYESGSGPNGTLSSGRVRKAMPTFTDAFKKVLVMAAANVNPLHEAAYQVLIDALSVRVREVYYGAKSLTFFSRSEYERLPKDERTGARLHDLGGGEVETVVAVKGAKSYFDGQSTLRAGHDTIYIDYDISQLPADEKPFAMLAVLGYIDENDIRTNSQNPKSAAPLMVLMDEAHLMLPHKRARLIVDQFYRTGRKRYVSTWLATQSASDFDLSDETRSIFQGVSTIFYLRHSKGAMEFIEKKSELPKALAESLLTIGYDPDVDGTDNAKAAKHRGEVIVQDAKRTAVIKVDYFKEIEAPIAETNMAEASKK
jgi:hypothetical protein